VNHFRSVATALIESQQTTLILPVNLCFKAIRPLVFRVQSHAGHASSAASLKSYLLQLPLFVKEVGRPHRPRGESCGWLLRYIDDGPVGEMRILQ
jgi:hypothetical protein